METKKTKKMESCEVIKAKLDWWKTWTGMMLGAALTSMVGYWAYYQKNQLAQDSFFIGSILFSVAFLGFMVGYNIRHKDYIDSLREKTSKSA